MRFYPRFETRLPALLALLATLIVAVPAQAQTAEPAAARPLIDACEKGDRGKCLILGSAYGRGELNEKKFPKDKGQSQHYIKKGLRLGEQQCAQNQPDACYDIGIMYFEGGMVETDFPRGLGYVQKSCELGYKEACVWLEDSGLSMGVTR